MLDTEPLAARAWGEAAAALGVDFDMSLAHAMIGRNFADCSAMLRAHYAAPYPVDALLGRWHAAYDAIVEREGLALKPGVHELLDWLEAQRDSARRRDVDPPRARARSKLARTALLAALSRDRRRRRGRARKARARHLRRGGAPTRRERRVLRRARGFGARRARGARRRNDADHGAGPAPAVGGARRARSRRAAVAARRACAISPRCRRDEPVRTRDPMR